MPVHAKLMRARIALQAKELKKSGHNKFAGFYYFELADMLPSIQQIFYDLGLCGTISFDLDYAALTVTDTEDMSHIEFRTPMSTCELKGCHAIQNLGAVETYIRRYLWVTALEVVEHDVLDAVSGKDEVKVAKPEIQMPKEKAIDKAEKEVEQERLAEIGEIKYLQNKLASLSVPTGEIFSEAGYQGTTDFLNLTKEQFDRIKKAIRGKK